MTAGSTDHKHSVPESGREGAADASLYERKIIHVDMDAFYASVEVRDRPELRGKPVIIGGRPERRGVVATCSYEARRFGVRSAMSSRRALTLCPQAIFLPPQFAKYQEVSQQIRAIFGRYTELVEPLSLDEAFLDVTANPQGLFAVQIARRIKEDIRRELGLTCSAGIAPNKMLAKIASELDKPDGIAVLLPEQVRGFMAELALRKIPGVGPATEKRLAALGYRHCQDLWPLSAAEIEAKLGERFGRWLYERSRGIDRRGLEVSRVRKSLGRETTFPADLHEMAAMQAALQGVVSELMSSLKKRPLAARKVTVKVKFADFRLATRCLTLPQATQDPVAVAEAAQLLLQRAVPPGKAIRLVGVSLAGLVSL